MKKKLAALFLLCASSLFAQKVEHGVLAGASLGFPLQDNEKYAGWQSDNWDYNHDIFGGGMVGYRFRFLPGQKMFYDLDLSVGFQSMGTYYYEPGLYGDGNGNYYTKDVKSFSEFILPISVTASWNYHLTKRFHLGAGVSPTLYASPQAVFDLGLVAKAGYRVCDHFEVGLSYRYGCLNVLKHFNDGPAMGRRGHLSDLMISFYVPFRVK